MKASHYFRSFALLLSLTLASCAEQGGYPFDLGKAEESTLHLAIQTPRQATLRGITDEDADPFLALHRLRFVFYSQGASPVVKEVRELEVTSSTDLKDLPVALPQGAYQLVVIGNPTEALRTFTEIGRPLTQVTTPQTGNLAQMLTDAPALSISMSNAGDPIAIAPSAFGSKTKTAPIKIEPTLARVLLYGEPTLAVGATKGKGTPGYLIQPQAAQVTVLRPLGLILSGGEETLGHRSEEANVYPKGPLFTAWGASQPTKLTELLRYFSQSQLFSTEGEKRWVPLAKDEAGLKVAQSKATCYAKETTLPATAYVTGAVPSLLIRYPYIPEGLTLDEGEGWLSFEGKYYTESKVKAGLTSGSFEDEDLLKALKQAGITKSSFIEPFEKEGIAFHYQGYSYYLYPIRHYDDTQAPDPTSIGRYGLVRGNDYRIHLTRILRPGRAVVPEMSTDMTPLKEEKDLRAQLEVRPLSVRRSEAHI